MAIGNITLEVASISLGYSSFQYSCLDNSMGRGAWKAMVLGVTESDLTMHAPTTTTQEFGNY